MAKETLSTDKLKEQALKEEEHFIEFIRESKLIFIGTVTDVGPAPKFWSGRVPSYQSVSYEVEDVLKGDNLSTIEVDHIVVSRSKTARSDEPGLSQSLFQKRNRLIVIAVQSDQGLWKSLDENLGAQQYSDENLNKIKKVLGKK